MDDSSPKNVDWYLARDGEQHGPLSDAEMRKFVELGHLRETDLVWCAGFDAWRPSSDVFPPAQHRKAVADSAGHDGSGENERAARGAQSEPRRGEHRRSKPDHRHASASQQSLETGPRRDEIDAAGIEIDDSGPYPASAGRGRGAAVRVVAMLLLVAGLGAGAWLVWMNRDRLGPLSGLVATASNTTSEAALRASPFLLNAPTSAAVEPALQRSAAWQIAKRDHPEWYADKAQRVAKLVAENADERAIARLLAESLVGLRREHSKAALQAPLPALRKIASTFIDNLAELSKLGAQQCFGFISFGEGTPLVVELSRTPAHAEHVQRQIVAVFEAAGEGRRSPTAHAQARRADYDMLSWELAKRNWTREDLVTFSDPRRLSALPPESVCKMVGDWFTAQLDVRDEDVQVRLLAHSLKPLIEG